MAHLCIGDTWNAITNVERRLGTSALYVLCVLASVYYAVSSYYAAVCARWIGAVHPPSDSARLTALSPTSLLLCSAASRGSPAGSVRLLAHHRHRAHLVDLVDQRAARAAAAAGWRRQERAAPAAAHRAARKVRWRWSDGEVDVSGVATPF